jgi:hypothetical protein
MTGLEQLFLAGAHHKLGFLKSKRAAHVDFIACAHCMKSLHEVMSKVRITIF